MDTTPRTASSSSHPSADPAPGPAPRPTSGRENGGLMYFFIGAAVVGFSAASMPVALPLLGLWLIAPAFVGWLGRPSTEPAPDAGVTDEGRRRLRVLARKTWRFFEANVGEADNWLPPDNLQEVPTPVLAHRTSPTNIGLALLSNLAAWDFGYIGMSELLLRGGNTLRAMDRLERHRGHFLNWYDTTSLQPLAPRYVSSVDSGNLAGALLTVSSACREIIDQPIPGLMGLAGIEDAVLPAGSCQ